jgi:hypothetical protein
MRNQPHLLSSLCLFTLMTLPALALTPIESWRQQNFQSTTNAGSAADTADPDGDGIVNLLEYALGLPPKTGSRVGLPAAGKTSDGRLLTITYQRNPALTDLTYEVEAANELGAWTTIARSTAGGATSNLGGRSEFIETGTVIKTVTVIDLSFINRTPKRWLRLKVSRS